MSNRRCFTPRWLIASTVAAGLVALAGCGSSGEDDRFLVEMELPDGTVTTFAATADDAVRSTEPRPDNLRYRVVPCATKVGIDKRCVVVESTPLHADRSAGMDAFEATITELLLGESFATCADEGVPNDIFLDVMAMIKESQSRMTFTISPYPCAGQTG